MKDLADFIFPTQKALFKQLRKMYAGNCLYSKGEFIFVKGDAPIMLVAHLDTVHAEPVKVICKSADDNIIMSPQGIGGDDRCGVYALATIYELADKKPCLLFTCNEEIGGLGAQAFCEFYYAGKLPSVLETLKFIVEVDRRGSQDAVYYDCFNPDFEDYITRKGFTTAFGTFSDISYIAPALSVAAVNLSSGYYNAHTRHEYINRAELETTIEKVLEMVNDAALDDFPRFDFEHVDYYQYENADEYQDEWEIPDEAKWLYTK